MAAAIAAAKARIAHKKLLAQANQVKVDSKKQKELLETLEKDKSTEFLYTCMKGSDASLSCLFISFLSCFLCFTT